MTIDPKEIEKRKLIDMEATEMEEVIKFLEAIHMRLSMHSTRFLTNITVC